MTVNKDEVVALYRDQNLTMQQIADRLGISKPRVHQVLREAGVPTGYRFRPVAKKKVSDKEYRTYRLSAQTRGLIDRLAEALGVSRTAVVTEAVAEFAKARLPGGGRQGQDGGPGGTKKARQGKRRGTKES